MDAVCEECGDVGVRELLLRCRKCKIAARHRYCLDKVMFDLVVEWSCSGCIPKHNEAIKSLEDGSNQRQLSSIQLDCSMVEESTVDNEKITKVRRPRTMRPHPKRKDRVDRSTKHFSSGDTSNWRNEPHKERRDGNDAITPQFCSGDTLESIEALVGDIPNNNDYEKEGVDRNDVEGSLPMIVDKSRPTSASVEQAGLSINKEKSAAEGLEKSAVASKFAPNYSKPREKSEPLEAIEGLETSAVASNFEPNRSKPREKSEPLEAIEGLEKSAVTSKFAPNRSKPIQGSDLKTQSADVLNPLKQRLDSWSMVPMQSSPSNDLEDVAVQENCAERTRYSVGEETKVPTMGNLKVSKPSVANECLVSNEGNSDRANRRSDEVLLSTKAKNRPMRMSGDREIANSYKVNGISNPESAKGDRDARNLQRNPGKPSSLVGPCEATKTNPRKRKQSESYTPDGTKSTIINETKIVNDAQSKGCKPAAAASVRDSQNMPREDNCSNEVTGHSKKGKYKKMDKSCLANKASRDSRKMRGMVTSVLELSSLHRSSVDKSRPCSENLNHLCSKNHKGVKKNRSMDANKDGNASVRNLDAGCAESNVSQLALQTGVKEGYCGISRMPPISECIDMQPLDEPYWTGIMKIDKNYIPLAAHLSTKAGKKVQEQSRSLPPIMKVTKLSVSKTFPKHLEAPIPSAGSIGLYFFSSAMRPNKELDQLVKHVADSGIILEAIVGLAKLFLFPSFVLPEGYQRFQGKAFLWGVFKPGKEKIKRLAPVEEDCTARITKEDHVQEQHVLDQQDKADGDTLDQVVHPENQPLLDANQEVGKEALSGNGLPLVDMRAIVSTNISPADQGQPCSNPEAPSLKICGFVVSRTPRSAQLIQEMRKEGALLFAVQPVMSEPGSVV